MKYLINETTKEERIELVYKALGISMSDADKPSKEAIFLVQKYIEGEVELEDIQKEIINLHKKKEEDE